MKPTIPERIILGKKSDNSMAVDAIKITRRAKNGIFTKPKRFDRYDDIKVVDNVFLDNFRFEFESKYASRCGSKAIFFLYHKNIGKLRITYEHFKSLFSSLDIKDGFIAEPLIYMTGHGFVSKRIADGILEKAREREEKEKEKLEEIKEKRVFKKDLEFGGIYKTISKYPDYFVYLGEIQDNGKKRGIYIYLSIHRLSRMLQGIEPWVDPYKIINTNFFRRVPSAGIRAAPEDSFTEKGVMFLPGTVDVKKIASQPKLMVLEGAPDSYNNFFSTFSVDFVKWIKNNLTKKYNYDTKWVDEYIEKRLSNQAQENALAD